MSAVDWMTGVVALGAGALVLFFIFQSTPSANESTGPAFLSLNGPSSVFIGEDVTLILEARAYGGQKLMIEGGEEPLYYACESNPCYFFPTFTFQEEGPHTLAVTAGTQRAEWVVSVQEKTVVCIDGTREGECSTPPQKCVDQKLVSDCQSCGCPTSQTCVDQACVIPAPLFSILLEEIPSPFYTTAPAALLVRLQNDSVYPANGLFVLRATWYDASQKKVGDAFQQVLVDNLSPADSVSIPLSLTLPLSAAWVGVELFPEGNTYNASTLLHSTGLTPINVVADDSPPLAPTQLSYDFIQNGVEFSWEKSASSDVQFYLLYQQNLATGGFTTYSLLTQTSLTTHTISPYSETDSLAYVVSARDYAGNESSASQPIVVSAP